MQDCFWSFYNQRNQTRYDGFKTAQARSFVSGLLPEHIADWIVWKEGTPEWQPLNEYKELFVDHSDFTFAAESEFNLAEHLTSAATDPRFEKENTFTNNESFDATRGEKMNLDQKIEETETDVLGGLVPEDDFFELDAAKEGDLDLAIESGRSKKPELRKDARYRHRFEAEVDPGVGKPFKTRTLDVSMGGLLVEQTIPENSKRNIKIKLTKGSEAIVCLCQNIPDRQGRISRRFRFLDVDRMDLLRNWLVQK